ncbi:phosphohistidine phosphatase SixA [Candidatus Cyanaurora vandensis]|nr:phosphohistidine phosphatase SixA [Candidatus Cyanaurora vandensis]
MDLYFVRHGLALDRSSSQPDMTRPLTREGMQRTRQMAHALKRLGVTWDLLLTSPVVRAMETALLLEEVGLTAALRVYAPLAPGGDITLFKDWLTTQEPLPTAIALVGHQPDLGHWIELLLYGQPYGQILLKKSGVARLAWQLEGAQLLWLLPPKLF